MQRIPGAILLAFLPCIGFGACTGSVSPPPPPDEAAHGTFLAVASTIDYQVGALSTVQLETLDVRKNIDTIAGNSIVRAYGTHVYVLDQMHGAVRVYDTARNFADPSEFALEKKSPDVPAATTNPHDIYVDEPRNLAYVTLYGDGKSRIITGETALAVIDLQNPAAGIARFVPLPAANKDLDQNPDAANLVGCGDKLMILLQDLDSTQKYAPSGPGRLAVLSLASSPPDVRIIQLVGENPTSLTVLSGCTEAIVGSSGNQRTAMLSGKSGIEQVDLMSGRSLGLNVTDFMLGGNVSAMDAIDGHNVYLDVSSRSGQDYFNNIYLVDAISSTVGPKLLGPMPYVPQVRVAANRLIVLAAGMPISGQLKSGLYIGPADGSPSPTDPAMDFIDLELAPISSDLFLR